MSNVTVKPANLPAATKPSALALAACEGINGEGRLFPEVSIKGGRWRLRPVGDGDEIVINSFTMNFAVVAANPAKSKTFYLQKYDPEGEPKAPDCSSDDGIRPKEGSLAPQSPTCAACPHNVWGSDTNPVSGKKTKLCKDSKRIAIMIEGNPAELYAWRLAPTSMLSFADTVRDAVKQGIDVDQVMFEGAFDIKSDFPRVVYKVLRALSPEELAAVNALRASEGALAAVGMGAPVVKAQQPTPVTPVAPVTTPTVAGNPVAPKDAIDLDSLLDSAL